jgi:hypothetical protein
MWSCSSTWPTAGLKNDFPAVAARERVLTIVGALERELAQ